ncbi:MAG: hypothetical protein ACLF0G_11350 [Candidatus Brocadiia bacterium]
MTWRCRTRPNRLDPKEHEQGDERLTQYDRLILDVFFQHYEQGAERIEFSKDELSGAATARGVTIRNMPDLIYTYRARRRLPQPILATGNWAIVAHGKGRYAFVLLANEPHFDIPFGDYAPVDIPNAIPDVVENFLSGDEQSLLISVLYNRLADIFTGLTCFHVQNHYRGFIAHLGQFELDDLYVGLDASGTIHILPLEAKSKSPADMLGRVQIGHMSQLARQNFPALSRRIIAVKALADETIGMVEFSDEVEPDEIRIRCVSRFRLVRRTRTHGGESPQH